jgi:hypothetical protein
MKAALFALALVGAVGCQADFTDYYFTGRVYDGAAGTRLVDYDIELQYLDRIVAGIVDEDGRYSIGPLEPFNDYTIAIRAEGFRSFLSHNLMKVNDEQTFNNDTNDDDTHPDRSQYFDAYLYPTNIVTTGVTFRVTASDSDVPPAGTIRLRPAGSSSLVNDPIEMPAGVGGQVWLNDEDLQFASVVRDFSDGIVNFADGDLIYGVTYVVTIYNVRGHAMTTGTYTAGVQSNASFVVDPLSATPIELAFVSTQLGAPSPSGEVVFVFNQPVQLDPLSTSDATVRSLEANFSIDSPDEDGDGMRNALEAFDPAAAAGSRGLSFEVSVNKLTLRWNPADALLTSDVDDPIRSVTYGGLGGITLRPLSGQASDARTVDALLGATSITVPVTP